MLPRNEREKVKGEMAIQSARVLPGRREMKRLRLARVVSFFDAEKALDVLGPVRNRVLVVDELCVVVHVAAPEYVSLSRSGASNPSRRPRDGLCRGAPSSLGVDDEDLNGEA